MSLITPFKEGTPLLFVQVRFPGHNKSYPFFSGKKSYSYGQKVVALSDRGMAVGYINSFPYSLPFSKDLLPLRTIKKIAEEEDVLQQKQLMAKEKQSEQVCSRLIENLALEMTLTHVELTQYGKKAVFYFMASGRVDFRELVKRLVAELKMQIELRQISARDRTAAMGSIGSCGLQTCCSSFLANYGNVTVKMAKNQNLSFNPAKLNGVCGQLKCCIKYEDEVYSHKRKTLPLEEDIVELLDGTKAKITSVNVIKEEFEIISDQGVKRRYTKHFFDSQASYEKVTRWSTPFPETFSHINDETYELIGPTPEMLNNKTSNLEEKSLGDEVHYEFSLPEINKELISGPIPKREREEHFKNFVF